jgi:hypothetical protein
MPESTTPSSSQPADSAQPARGAGACRMPQPRVVAAKRVGRTITVQWSVSARPPAACGRVGLLITARSLTGDMPALPARGTNGGGVELGSTSGTAKLIDIVGPIMPPYEADVSLFSQHGGEARANAPVSATDDPSRAAVRKEIRRREACGADAGHPSTCHFSPLNPTVPLSGVTARSLARAVRQQMADRSADIAVQHVTCRPAWRCTVAFTLDYGRYPMRVTYRLRGTAPGCWTLNGWSFTKPGPNGAALPTPSTGCVQRR